MKKIPMKLDEVLYYKHRLKGYLPRVTHGWHLSCSENILFIDDTKQSWNCYLYIPGKKTEQFPHGFVQYIQSVFSFDAYDYSLYLEEERQQEKRLAMPWREESEDG